MARPEKSGIDRRIFIIRVRMTANERKQLVEAAGVAGFNLSDYIRVKVITSLPRFRKPTPEREALIRGLAELGKIGSNINQIAKAINRWQITGECSALPDKELVARSLHGIDILAHHLIQLLEHGH